VAAPRSLTAYQLLPSAPFRSDLNFFGLSPCLREQGSETERGSISLVGGTSPGKFVWTELNAPKVASMEHSA
jgi:hypothetical protein